MVGVGEGWVILSRREKECEISFYSIKIVKMKFLYKFIKLRDQYMYVQGVPRNMTIDK